MRIKSLIQLASVLLLGGAMTACVNREPAPPTEFEQKVMDAVKFQREVYPLSTLQDMYKNFMQDRYGPGHLITDTEEADQYLRKEIAEMTYGGEPMFDPIGWEGNFVRVNLIVLQREMLSYDLFFDTFLRSANETVMPTIEAWKKEWNAILAVIESLRLDIANFDNDKKTIADLLESGGYMIHHSAVFEEHYNPHYRIIDRTIFLEELLPEML